MLRLSSIAVVGCVVASLSAAAASAPQATLSARLEDVRAKANLPAVAGTVFTSDSVAQVAAVGVRRLGDTAVVTPGDLWHIGSITKSFTSALVGKFVERGELAWTSTLGELLGAERAGKFSTVTLLNLLSHRAGLPANVTPAMSADLLPLTAPVAEQRKRIMEVVLAGAPASAPGETMVYSNLGYVIAGAMLEAKAGRAWEELVHAEVITPAGITGAGFGAPGTAGAVTQPRGHRQSAAGLSPVEPGPGSDNRPYLGPAGTLHMTVADLARWGQAHLRGERGRDGFLKAATFRRLHEPPAAAGASYALGWVVRRDADRRTIWHNGSNTMWYAIVAFDPDADRGAVVVTNGSIAAAQAIDAAAMALIREPRG